LKVCIWCRRTEQETNFIKLAHTIPQTLGGQNICSNVCDICNDFFGRHYQGSPSVELILKETFNISRMKLLHSQNEIGKNKALAKFSSTYFNVDIKKHKIELKLTYKLQKSFQEKLCRQLKKGIYKIFLEERERQKGDAQDSRYDFIREFARYNLGDYPVFYFERTKPLIVMPKTLAAKPDFFLDDGFRMNYLVNEPSFFEFEFFGHVFGIATSRIWELAWDNYLKKTMEAKIGHFRIWRRINNFNDIDLSLKILDN